MRTETTKIARTCIVGFIAGTVSYLYVWLTPRASNLILWLALCALAGFVTFLISDTKMVIALTSVVTGAFSLNLAHIVVDAAIDPTSHNLFPFELAFTLLLTAAGAAMGVGLAILAKHLIGNGRISQ